MTARSLQIVTQMSDQVIASEIQSVLGRMCCGAEPFVTVRELAGKVRPLLVRGDSVEPITLAMFTKLRERYPTFMNDHDAALCMCSIAVHRWVMASLKSVFTAAPTQEPAPEAATSPT